MQAKQDYFKNYPKVNEFFFTSDGEAHFTEHDAKAHASGLADKKVEHVKRNDLTETKPKQVSKSK